MDVRVFECEGGYVGAEKDVGGVGERRRATGNTNSIVAVWMVAKGRDINICG